MAKQKPDQVAELRAQVADLESDLSTVRRSFLDYVRHTAGLVPRDRGLGNLFSSGLCEAMRDRIDAIGIHEAWLEFKNSATYREAGELTQRIFLLHFHHAFCESAADEIHRAISAQ